MEQSATYYYVTVMVEVEGQDYPFRDEGPGFESEEQAFEFAREVWRELGRRGGVKVSKEWTDKFGRFQKVTLEVPFLGISEGDPS